jgi:hypothetical protein
VALAVIGVLLAVVAAGLIWALTPLGPTSAARAALRTSGGVTVTETNSGWEFAPSVEATAGVLIYPGGRVDARSYALLARGLAEDGYFAVIVRMPLSLAVLSPDAGDAVLAAHPEIGRWAIAGHSLGGAMAARYASTHLGKVGGLVLLAAYPEDSIDLRESGLAVADVVGTNDRVVDSAAWERGLSRLPEGTEVVRIEGGNHAQFGSYGKQPGDGAAGVTAEVQRAVTIDAIKRVLWRLP